MYKARLAQWGLKKNLTAQDVPELLHQISKENSGDPGALVARGRRVRPEKVKQYMKRSATVALLIDHNCASHGQAHAPASSPTPRLMSLSNDMKLPYEVVQLSRQFIAGCRDAADPVFYPSRDISTWLDETWAAGSLFERRHFKQAFYFLDIAFDRLKELMRNPEPMLFIFAYYILIRLPEEISQRLCTYVAEMTTILLSANHPMTLIWSRLSQTNHRQRLDHGWTILHSYFQSVKQQFHDEYRVLKFSRVFYVLAFDTEILDLETVQAAITDIVADLERLECCRDDIFKTRLSLADILFRNAKHEAVEKIMKEVGDGLHQDDADLSPLTRCNYYCLAFQVHKAAGNTEASVDMGKRLLRSVATSTGFSSGTTLDTINEVQSYLAEIGILDEASKLLQVLNDKDRIEQALLEYFQNIDMNGDNRLCESSDS